MHSERIYRTHNNDPMFRKQEAQVLNKDTISQMEIRNMAGRIAREIRARAKASGKNESPAAVILDLFNESYLYQTLKAEIIDKDEPISLDREEVVEALKPIRAAILRELKKEYPDVEWYGLGEKMDTKTKNEFHHISDKHIVKTVPEFLNANTQVALEDLYRMKERSPFIAYHHKMRDPENKLEISKHIPIDNLKASLERKEGQRPRFEDVIRQYLDNVRGLQFLIEHDFAMSDLSLDNLGINTETGNGCLFDLDTVLRQEDVSDENWLGKITHAPPEYLGVVSYIENPDIPVREPQSVYELGLSLSDILNKYTSTPSINTDLFLMATLYANAMTSRQPNARPRVADVIKDLEVYCEQPKTQTAS